MQRTHLDTRIIVPGSKSITNRAFVVAALAKGTTEIRNTLISDDTEAMLQCLGKLGVEIDRFDPRNVVVEGSGGTRSESCQLFVGNAGTTARFLIAVAATVGQKVGFDGDGYMRERPMGPILHAIESIGAEHNSPHGKMPFEITGNPELHAQWAEQGYRPTVVICRLKSTAPRCRILCRHLLSLQHSTIRLSSLRESRTCA